METLSFSRISAFKNKLIGIKSTYTPEMSEKGRRVQREVITSISNRNFPQALSRHLSEYSLFSAGNDSRAIRVSNGDDGWKHELSASPDLFASDKEDRIHLWLEIKMRGYEIPEDHVQSTLAYLVGEKRYSTSDLFGNGGDFKYFFYYAGSQSVVEVKSPGDREREAVNSLCWVVVQMLADEKHEKLASPEKLKMLYENFEVLTGRGEQPVIGL